MKIIPPTDATLLSRRAFVFGGIAGTLSLALSLGRASDAGADPCRDGYGEVWGLDSSGEHVWKNGRARHASAACQDFAANRWFASSAAAAKRWDQSVSTAKRSGAWENCRAHACCLCTPMLLGYPAAADWNALFGPSGRADTDADDKVNLGRSTPPTRRRHS